MHVGTSHRHEIELNTILDFIGKDSPKNALNFARKLDAKINDLPHFPYKCRQSPKSTDTTIRELIFEGYVIPNTLGIFSENEWIL
jgi:plasmid stabilization system protein ParE